MDLDNDGRKDLVAGSFGGQVYWLRHDEKGFLAEETLKDVKGRDVTLTEYYDHKKKEWDNEWTTMNASGAQYLPTHIRITITILDERGMEVSYSTDARIQMTEKVSYRPAAQ